MKYLEFVQSLNEVEKQTYTLPFSFAGVKKEELFNACYKLAETIANLTEINAKEIANILSKIPAQFASIVLVIAKKLNAEKVSEIIQIQNELSEIYLLDFKKYSKRNNFSVYNNKTIEKYLNFEQRIVDNVEIMKLCSMLKVNRNNVIGKYSGTDETTKILSGAMHKIRNNPTLSIKIELFNQVLLPLIEKANSDLITYQNKISV